MKQLYFAAIVLALGIPVPDSIYAESCNSVPYIAIRSQGLDGARALVGLANNYHINLYNTCHTYGTWAITLEYTHSFHAKQLAQCLFGSALTTFGDCSQIRISGSDVENRGEHDWLADYFGLPRDFQSVITLDPTIENIIADFNWYLTLDSCIPGLYAKAYLPVVHTRWNLQAKEKVEQRGVIGYEAGYFGPETIPVSRLAHRATEFFSGEFSLQNMQPLRASKWAVKNNCPQTVTATKIAEARFMLGYNVWLEEDSHLGFELRLAVPTGTKPNGEFLFEPVVGNGHHWEFGAGFSGHILFWEDDDSDGTFGLYTDANITHLFSNQQCRVFDLCNRASSRYMLAIQLAKQQGSDLLQGNEQPATESPIMQGFTQAAAVFAGNYAPVANVSTTRVEVSYAAQGEIIILFDYTCNGWSYDLGYNFWARSCTKFDNPCFTLNDNTWALKGDAHVFGFPLLNTAGSAQADIDTDGVSLSATEHMATIFSGTNILRCNTPAHPEQNPRVDNPEFAYQNDFPVLATNTTNRTVSEALEDQTRTSIQPDFLSQNSLFLNGARSRGITHKLFAHVSYTGCDRDSWTPFIGIGGKAEWAIKHDECPFGCQQTLFCPSPCNPCPPPCRPLPTMCGPNDCTQSCNACQVCAVSEWGVWIKGGISFR